ncbi:hypothetical protein WJX82_010362 [Trebouxia sp. C0006]
MPEVEDALRRLLDDLRLFRSFCLRAQPTVCWTWLACIRDWSSFCSAGAKRLRSIAANLSAERPASAGPSWTV